MSKAVEISRLRICAEVKEGLNDFNSAATAAAWGAAADVPKNGLRPEPGGKVVLTPSAAAMSGF